MSAFPMAASFLSYTDFRLNGTYSESDIQVTLHNEMSFPHMLPSYNNKLLASCFLHCTYCNCFIIYELCRGRNFFLLLLFTFVPEPSMGPRKYLGLPPPFLLGSLCDFLGFWFRSHFLREHFLDPRLSEIPVLCFHNPLDSSCHNAHRISLS